MQLNSLKICTLFFILIISSISILKAQPKKGAWLFEGDLGNIQVLNNKSNFPTSSYISNTTSKGLTVSLFPAIGYCLYDNVVFGTMVNFDFQSTHYNSFYTNGRTASDANYKSSSLGLSPYLRCYFLTSKTLKNKFYVQFGGGANFILNNKQTGTDYLSNGSLSDVYNTTIKGRNNLALGLVGWNHFFTENVAFNAAIGYVYSKTKQSLKSTTVTGNSTFTSPELKSEYTNTSLLWNFGFTIILPNKSE